MEHDMKKKYKVQIILTCIIISGIWGMLSTYLLLQYPYNKAVTAIISFIIYTVCLIIGVKIIAGKAKKDLNVS
jgi:ABC-type uncharacterized transport system permease subunit